MKILDLNILGIPNAKQSAKFRAFKMGNRTIAQTYQPPDVVQGNNNLRAQIIEQLPKDYVPFSEMVSIARLEFIFPFLKSLSKKKIQQYEADDIQIYKTTKPDLDNLEKMLWDACNGVVFNDDSLICSKQSISKKYGRIPCIKLRIIGK